MEGLKSKHSYVRQLTLTAIMAALSVVFTRFLSFYIFGNTIRISFGMVPIQLTGLLLGPIWGGLCGLVADLVGILINPMGTPFWGFTLSAVLQGVIPGFIAMLFLGKGKKTWQEVLSSVALTSVFIGLLLQSLWLHILMKRPYVEVLAVRALPGFISAIIYFMLELPLITYLRKLMPEFGTKKKLKTSKS